MRKILFSFFFLLLFTSLSLASVEKFLINCVDVNDQVIDSSDYSLLVSFVPSETGKDDLGTYFVRKEPMVTDSTTVNYQVPITKGNYHSGSNFLFFTASDKKGGYAVIYQKGDFSLVDIDLTNPVDKSTIKTGKLVGKFFCFEAPNPFPQ